MTQKKQQKQQKTLTAEDILGVTQDFEMQQVEVPEWGGIVFVREMSERDYTDWMEESREIAQGEQLEGEEQENLPSTAAVGIMLRTVCDDTGQLLFSLEQAEKTRDKSIKVLNRIVNAALELNGLNIKDEEELVGKLNESGSTTD